MGVANARRGGGEGEGEVGGPVHHVPSHSLRVYHNVHCVWCGQAASDNQFFFSFEGLTVDVPFVGTRLVVPPPATYALIAVPPLVYTALVLSGFFAKVRHPTILQFAGAHGCDWGGLGVGTRAAPVPPATWQCSAVGL
jgi:hypothetical protein